ncbi:hypothetical protein COV18_00615 [Candidatus Woesearchaeota archaeon CG10_big_fil_rev_8_21_14_0_10_37_12]|nr:MAG: hypothetical protein COV18_00615 [Candidatus Woesearchaeota archaeon CG10_big_fil_rev_8_21_14_0_10_37_12]
MAKRGRPVKSEIRQNIIEILNVIGKAYGYLIHKYYSELFPACTRENIYYNLRKGVQLEEFELVEVKEEAGEYSWGSVVEKKYYVLGSKAAPRGNSKVREFFEGLNRVRKENSKKYQG